MPVQTKKSNASHTSGIKKRAKEIGFSHVGIAQAEPLVLERERLEEWLRHGFNAGMEYMARDPERRADPEYILSGARSVIALGYNYYTPFERVHDFGIGKISRYAWGYDYHDLIRPKLSELEMYLSELIPGSVSKSFVDSGSVMEKAWAVRAGIGWQGKHSIIITPDIGSWIFLGIIFTTAELECDEPIPDFCGECARCIEACPTGAISEPYVLDASKCISYWTIEFKGESIPNAETMDFRNWIFGCDACADACPWNELAKPAGDQTISPSEDTLSPELYNLLALEEEEFKVRFRKSVLERAKLSGLKRNVRTVLAQQESNSTSKLPY